MPPPQRQSVQVNFTTTANLRGITLIQQALARVLGMARTAVPVANLLSAGTAGPRNSSTQGVVNYSPTPRAPRPITPEQYDRYKNRMAAQERAQEREQQRQERAVEQQQAQAERQRKQKFQEYVESPGQRFIQAGLGSSVEGFLFASAEKFMAMDTTLARLGRRFRDTGQAVGWFGARMGMTVEQTSQLADTLGGETNTVSRGQFQRYAGFGRDRGLDQGATMKALGRLQALQGREVTDNQLLALAGRASARGMGQGRLGEYLDSVNTLAQDQFMATGQMNLSRVLGLQDLPGMVFGMNDPRGRGQAGMSMINGLQGMLTSGGPMEAFLMRSMGYGQAGGPGYMDMRERLEAGVNDPENLISLFGEMQARGMSKGGMYRALESVSGGKLKAWQLRGLVEKFGSAEGLDDLKSLRDNGGDMSASLGELTAMTDEERARYRRGGFAAAGAATVSMGEGAAVEMEDMQYQTGKYTAPAMLDARDIIKNVAEAWVKLLGQNPGVMLDQGMDYLKNASDKLPDMVPGDWKEIGGLIASGFTDWLQSSSAGLAVRTLANPVTTTIGEVSKRVSANKATVGGAGP